MPGRRKALIIATDDYVHPGLRRLNAPAADARALERVLGDQDIGGFEVQVVLNEPAHTTQGIIEDLFSESRFEDVLLLHFSCHGLKNESGELYFAARNTRPDRLGSTAIAADFVQRCIKSCRARSVVLFLDCCYGGAYGEGVAVRAAGSAGVLDAFPAGKLGGGRGRAVISASSAMEYAFEGSDLVDTHERPSIFTSAVVQGLESGEADRDEDGLVSLDELYDYVFDKVRADSPSQTPTRDVEMQGDLYLARSNRKRITASPIPADVAAALADANMYARIGAVAELGNRLASPDPGISLGAREALVRVAREDITYVADAARAALTTVQVEPARPAESAAPTEAAAPVMPAPGTAPERTDVPALLSASGPLPTVPPSLGGTERPRAGASIGPGESRSRDRRTILGATSLVCGGIVLVCILRPYLGDTSLRDWAPWLVWFMLPLGTLAIIAGVLILAVHRAASDSPGQFWLGRGLLMAVALASSWGLVVAVEIANTYDDGYSFAVGFLLAFVAQAGLLVTGLVTTIGLVRRHDATLAVPRSRDVVGIAIAVIGVGAALLLVPEIVAGFTGSDPYAFGTLWLALLTLIVSAVTLALRPMLAGSALALGWALCALAIIAASLAYTIQTGSDSGGLVPVAVCMVVVAGLAVVRMLLAPPSPRVDV